MKAKPAERGQLEGLGGPDHRFFIINLWRFQSSGYLTPNNKDHRSLRSMLGSPYFGKLPFKARDHAKRTSYMRAFLLSASKIWDASPTAGQPHMMQEDFQTRHKRIKPKDDRAAYTSYGLFSKTMGSFGLKKHVAARNIWGYQNTTLILGTTHVHAPWGCTWGRASGI